MKKIDNNIKISTKCNFKIFRKGSKI